jgi:hypothetical protein
MGARHSNANSEVQQDILSAMEGFRLVSDKVQVELIISIDLLNQYELEFANLPTDLEGSVTLLGEQIQKLLSVIKSKLPETSPLKLSCKTLIHENTQTEYKVYSLVLKRREQEAEAPRQHQMLEQELETQTLREQQEFKRTLMKELLERQALVV